MQGAYYGEYGGARSSYKNCLDVLLEEREALARQRRVKIINDAQIVIDKCNEFLQKCDDADDAKFVKELGDYLSLKARETISSNKKYGELQNRSEFAASVLNLVSSKDTATQIHFLADKHIRHFKGWRTQRLYDILTNRRKSIERMKIIHETLAPMPTALTNLVISYERNTTLLLRR